jgi:DNA helicase-2/ATP-dependent DNA helicase PcrA
VGITRAKERLFISHAWSRTLFGSTQYNPPSRFVEEIPAELMEQLGESNRRTSSRAAYRSRLNRLDDGAWAEHRERVVDAALQAGRRPGGPDPTGADQLRLRLGDDVRHATYGEGVVVDLAGVGDKAEARVRFPEVGEKTFLLAWTPLERVERV